MKTRVKRQILSLYAQLRPVLEKDRVNGHVFDRISPARRGEKTCHQRVINAPHPVPGGLCLHPANAG